MRRLALLCLHALSGGLVACGAILGLSEPTLDNSIGDGGGGGGDGACTSTTSDPLNCGTCGHDCLGGACMAGQCQPFLLAKNQAGPFMVTQFADRVFWTDFEGSTVQSADKVDASMNLIASGTNGADMPIGLAVDDSGVYFANNGTSGTVLACSNPANCQVATTLFDAGFGNSDLALNGGDVYWLQSYGDEVDRVPITGGNYQTLAMTDTNSNAALLARIATDGQFIYWSETNNDIVRRKSLTGGTPTTIYTVSSGSAPSALLLDTGVLYFATFGVNNGTGTIASGSPDGTGGAQTLAASQHNPYALASDSEAIYWTAECDFDTSENVVMGTGGVLSCAKAGCGGNPTVLATGLSDARGIAVDDVAIYFATFETGMGDGKIWRLAK
jgi:hypothetical protein